MSSNNNILDIYLAEQLALAYETASQANLREMDLRGQCNAMREQIAHLDEQLLDRDMALDQTTQRHNRLAITNERLRLRIEGMERAMIAMRTSLARYRAESSASAYRRIPESFRPVLNRVRENLEQERQVRRRLAFEDLDME
jgi:hypothetical protein